MTRLWQFLTPARLLVAWSLFIIGSLIAIWLRSDTPDEPGPVHQDVSTDGSTVRTIQVKEVKFAKRRGLHFLSATTNFRSTANRPVAIREADFDKFRAGIGDLQEHYQGKTIRARGTELEDEGQNLLLVASPEQIEIVPSQPDAPPHKVLTLVNDAGKATEFAVPIAAEIERRTVKVEHEGQQETYTGVPLVALLRKAGCPLGADLRGTELARYVLVTGQDGYYSLLSLPEVDPYFTEQNVMLAETCDGKPLPPATGPLQLIVPGDHRRRRWVGQVDRLEVKRISPSTPGARK